jgi:hypothetical protein
VRQSPCEPPDIVFASEEKVLLAGLEPFKTPIGSGLIGQFVAIRLDCLSLYPRNQPLESAQVIESRPKIDPGTLLQERVERFGACSWQQDRYNPEIVPASRSLVQDNLHLLNVPSSPALWAEENCGGGTLFDGTLKLGLPGLSGHKMPFVEKRQ